MKTALKILLGLAAALVLVVLVGYAMPETAHVERSVVIDAPREAVFPLVNELPNWTRWDPWHEMEPTVVREYTDATSGAGAAYTWRGEKTGAGKLTVTEVVPNERIETDLYFEGQGEAECSYRFSALGDGRTEVTWAFDTSADGSPVGRWFNVFMDRMLGPDFERGLGNLKRVAEAG